MMKHLLFLFMCTSTAILAQEAISPLIPNEYQEVTSYDQLSGFAEQLGSSSGLLTTEVIGRSVEGRNIYAFLFSNDVFGEDDSKAKVLLFAQQHGNEQSGKEGALLLAQSLIRPENSYLFEKIDLAIIPQVNPDGSERNQRRNLNDADLNRNHLILTEPETAALHQFFDRYLFEVTMDVHEYYPYSEAWLKYGYRKNSDVKVGTLTNINVSEKIRKFSDEQYLPYIFNYLGERGFSAFEYCPGGPPEEYYMRKSTFDINDGRQSLGIQNTLSFIQEGMNGEDNYVQNIASRANGQMTGMMGLLVFVHQHSETIKGLVEAERVQLTEGRDREIVPVQMEHTGQGEPMQLPVYATFSRSDSLITVDDYRPVVKALTTVSKPLGYLIPVRNVALTDWVSRSNITTGKIDLNGPYLIEQYFIRQIDSIDFEGDIIIDPIVEAHPCEEALIAEDFIYVPSAQLKGNLIVEALEPRSMLGLSTYPAFKELAKAGEEYPILRVIRK